jgi:hypothetical protein
VAKGEDARFAAAFIRIENHTSSTRGSSPLHSRHPAVIVQEWYDCVCPMTLCETCTRRGRRRTSRSFRRYAGLSCFEPSRWAG